MDRPRETRSVGKSCGVSQTGPAVSAMPSLPFTTGFEASRPLAIHDNEQVEVNGRQVRGKERLSRKGRKAKSKNS